MISAYTLPIMSNTVEKRIKLIKETAAELGINAVVVLQDDIKLGPSGPLNEHVGPGRSIAILANIGSAPQQNSKDSPKFIVCLPNINFGIIEKDRVLELLENYLREHIIYSLGYQKGYYVYKCDAPGVDSAGILNGSASPNALIEPIGITPDFLLLCNVEVYDADYGKNGKTVFNAFGISMTLYDLMERKAIWTGKTEKILGRSVLVTPLEGLGSPFLVPEVLGDAIMKAIDTIPSVEGFRMGPASKY